MVKFNFLDFLTDSPNAFIFQKEKNKTNFGGVLFLLYIIIMALISLTYIYDWAINDKYIVDALTHINTTYIGKDQQLETDDDLNPYANFNVTISREKDDLAQFVIVTNGDEFKTEDYRLAYASIFNLPRMRVNELFFTIAFVCGKDVNCSSYDEEKNTIYVVSLNYTGYTLYHEDDIPLVITEDSPKTFTFEI